MARVNLKEHLRTIEKQFIEEFMIACNGSIALASHYLMMKRTTLHFRIRRLGLTQWIKIKGETSQ